MGSRTYRKGKACSTGFALPIRSRLLTTAWVSPLFRWDPHRPTYSLMLNSDEVHLCHSWRRSRSTHPLFPIVMRRGNSCIRQSRHRSQFLTFASLCFEVIALTSKRLFVYSSTQEARHWTLQVTYVFRVAFPAFMTTSENLRFNSVKCQFSWVRVRVQLSQQAATATTYTLSINVRWHLDWQVALLSLRPWHDCVLVLCM